MGESAVDCMITHLCGTKCNRRVSGVPNNTRKMRHVHVTSVTGVASVSSVAEANTRERP